MGRPVLIWDDHTKSEFRTFPELRISGSGQPPNFSFLKTLARDGVVIDLRNEPHAFLNGRPFSWFQPPKNSYGQDLIVGQVAPFSQTDHLLRSSIRDLPLLMTIYSDNTLSKSEIIPRQEVITEEELVNAAGWRYIRLPIVDHQPPTPAVVNELRRVYEFLPCNTWVHFHCAGGDGRTTTMMLLYNILKTGKEQSFDEIYQHQVANGGKDICGKENEERQCQLVKDFFNFS